MDPIKVPNHLAIIPDGNRRWAKGRGLQPWLGHQRGFSTLQELFQTALSNGVRYITLWGASVDNLLKRDKVEVKYLLGIIKQELSAPSLLEFLHNSETNIKILGEWAEIIQDPALKERIEELEQQTHQYQQNYITILFAYDGKREMLGAIRKLSQPGNDISEASLKRSLLTGHLPDVDFVIRTGGQPHWSAGFMMWLTANSEFYFTETLWPDFTPEELKEALKDYAERRRKLGG